MERKIISTKTKNTTNKRNETKIEVSETGFIRKSNYEASFMSSVTETEILIDKFPFRNSTDDTSTQTGEGNVATSRLLSGGDFNRCSEKPKRNCSNENPGIDSRLNEILVESTVGDGSLNYRSLFANETFQATSDDEDEVEEITDIKTAELNRNDCVVDRSLKERSAAYKISNKNNFENENSNSSSVQLKILLTKQDDNYTQLKSNKECELGFKNSNKSSNHGSKFEFVRTKPSPTPNAEKSRTTFPHINSSCCSSDVFDSNGQSSNKSVKIIINQQKSYTFEGQEDVSWFPPDCGDKDILRGSVRRLVNYFENLMKINIKMRNSFLHHKVDKEHMTCEESKTIKLSPERKTMSKLTSTSKPTISKSDLPKNLTDIKSLQDYSLRTKNCRNKCDKCIEAFNTFTEMSMCSKYNNHPERHSKIHNLSSFNLPPVDILMPSGEKPSKTEQIIDAQPVKSPSYKIMKKLNTKRKTRM